MKKILIVEDEDIIAIDIKNIIENIGNYSPIIAKSGKQALYLYDEKKPDLILMDINLTGDMDGIKTAAEIRKYSDIPIIYLTAYADKNTVERAKLTEPHGYILKPFNEIEIRTNIEIALYKYYMTQKFLERERLLSITLTKIGMGIIKTDNIFKIQFINNVALKLFSVKEEEIIGKVIDKAITFINEENNEESSLQTLLDSPANNICVIVNNNLIPISMIIESIEEDNKTNSYIFIIKDLSEKRSIENKMWTTANILERTIQSIQHAVFVTSIDFIIKDCNPAAENIFSYPKKELLQKSINFLFSDTVNTVNSKTALNKAITNRLFYQTIETSMLRKNQEPFPAEFTIAPLIDEKFNISGWILTVMDITEKKKYENILKQAKETAEKANHAKTEFLTNMSHELRTPLNSIIGMTELTLDTALTTEQKEYLTIVKQASHTFLQALNNILDFSKLEVGKVELEAINFNLHDLIKELRDLLTIQAQQKNLKFSINIDPHTPKIIHGDSYRFKQVLINLIVNAIKFTEEGFIKVTIKQEKIENNKITIHCIVEDTGIGIPPDKLDTIFESFLQLDGSMTRKYGGAGLGLAITKQLISLMGGSIWVDTMPNKGSAFHFTVNFKSKQLDSNKLTQNLRYAIKRRKVKIIDNESDTKPVFTILVVEDDNHTQKIICNLLEKRGHSIFCVSNGKEALNIIEKIKFDLILMDLEMPVLDGLETTKIIRASKKNSYFSAVPIIAITAHVEKDCKNRCLEAGMNDYISKPINFNELLTFIEEKYNPYHNKNNKQKPSRPTELIDKNLILSFCNNNNKDLNSFINEICAELKRLYTFIKQAVQRSENNEIEKYASALKNIAIKIGAELLKDDSLKIKINARKKTKSKVMAMEEDLATHISQIEKALKIFSIDNKKGAVTL